MRVVVKPISLTVSLAECISLLLSLTGLSQYLYSTILITHWLCLILAGEIIRSCYNLVSLMMAWH